MVRVKGEYQKSQAGNSFWCKHGIFIRHSKIMIIFYLPFKLETIVVVTDAVSLKLNSPECTTV